LRKVGARIVSDREAESDVDNWSDFPVDCVVAGIDRHFTYDKLRLAQRFILKGARFIATNRDSTFPVADGVCPAPAQLWRPSKPPAASARLQSASRSR
jgi:4-nitrophenyl phosphatase